MKRRNLFTVHKLAKHIHARAAKAQSDIAAYAELDSLFRSANRIENEEMYIKIARIYMQQYGKPLSDVINTVDTQNINGSIIFTLKSLGL